MILKFIHVVASVSVAFVLLLSNVPMPQFVHLVSYDRTSELFSVSAIINKFTINILMQAYLWTFIFISL